MEHDTSSLVIAIREAIDAFLDEKKTAKLQENEKVYEKMIKKCSIADYDVRQRLQSEQESKAKIIEEKYCRETWIADAARRASHISMVTHASKFSHSRAATSNVYSPAACVIDDYVCTDASNQFEDVVGSAASLDVYKFLRLEAQGKTLFSYVRDESPALADAFGVDEERVHVWCKLFKKMCEPADTIFSHELSRQVYFPLPDGGYHLLNLLYPTSLVQDYYLKLQESRFGDAAKEARNAKEKNQPCDHGYVEYPDLLVQHYGGSKPLNISQLNCERNGENFLLSACPPIWNSKPAHLPLHVDTVFGSTLLKIYSIRNGIEKLRTFLEEIKYNNFSVRQYRADQIDNIIISMLNWAAQLQEKAGWSNVKDCHLPEAELCWLDPSHAIELGLDVSENSSWRADICNSFSHWLNKQLSTNILQMGKSEREEWRRVLKEALHTFEEDMRHD